MEGLLVQVLDWNKRSHKDMARGLGGGRGAGVAEGDVTFWQTDQRGSREV